MSKRTFILPAFILLTSIILAGSAAANWGKQPGRTIILPKDEVVSGDYFATGETVILSGTVNGDAYVAGGSVVVEGTVNGDLLVVGGVVNLLGNVTGNIRAAGGQVALGGVVGRNVTLVGGSVNVGSTTTTGGNLVMAGGALSVLAPVSKDLSVAGGQLILGNTVDGNMNAVIDQLTFTPQAEIKGDFNSWSQKETAFAYEKQVVGKVTHNLLPEKPVREIKPYRFLGFIGGLWLGFTLLGLLIFLLAGFLLQRLLPNCTQRTVAAILEKPWASLGLGFLVALLTPAVIVLLFLGVVTIPLAILLIVICLLITFLGQIFIVVSLGQVILRKATGKTFVGWALLVGAVVYFVVIAIPFLGWLAKLVFLMVGLGAVLIEKKDFYTKLRQEKLL